jgi:hypothetical protein
MDADPADDRTGAGSLGRRGSRCLVAGCTCKDARIVSARRARFFAALARSNGETAWRVIAPDPGWVLPAAS